MNLSPKEESEILLNALLPFAEQLLEKQNEFFPFAAVMLSNGEVQMLATYDGKEYVESQKIIDDTKKIFIRGVKNNEYKATGLAYLIGVINKDTGNKEDAICVNLDHVNDYSIKVIYPYSIKKKFLGKRTVEIFTPTAVEGSGEVFEI